MTETIITDLSQATTEEQIRAFFDRKHAQLRAQKVQAAPVQTRVTPRNLAEQNQLAERNNAAVAAHNSTKPSELGLLGNNWGLPGLKRGPTFG